MKGTVISRGNKHAVVIDLGRQPAQRCPQCRNGRAKVFWVDNKLHTKCPKCGGKLEDVLRRRREWHSGFDTKDEAEEERIRILRDHQTGQNVTPDNMTVKEFLSEWLITAEGYTAATTFANYSHQLRVYVAPRIGHIRLQKLKTPDLNKFYTGLLKNGRTQGDGGPLSKKSVRNVHAVLRKALQDATEWGYIVRNPAANAKAPVPGRREMKTWSPSEVKRFLEAEQDSRWFAVWRLAATTGMRRGEVIGVTHDDLDLENGVLSIRQTIVLVSNTPMIRHEAKSDSGRRSVSLDPVTVRILRRHKAGQAAEALEAGEAWQNEHNKLVFTDQLGRMLKPERVTRHFNAMVEKHGLPKIRLHDLRHSWASHALASNVHPKVVQERLGHASIQLTMNTYSHVVPGMDQEAANRVADLYQ